MTATPRAVLTENPYPGLRPFEEEDSFLFFGRQRQIRELLARLDDRRFLAVVGLSGSGKSSLVRAGLIPALRRGGLSDSGVRWRIALLRPGSDPIGALSAALNRPEVLGPSVDRDSLLRGSSAGLVQAGRSGRKPVHNLLVVVDQFEELFRFRKENTHRWSEAIDFVELLLTAAREHTPEYRIYVVITIRSDYLGDCAQFRDLSEELNRSQYLVSRLSDDQWYEAIEGPARLTGARIEPQLLQRLMADAGDQPDQLPILQHLLSRMWDKRADPHLITLDSYRSVGGWQHALDQHVSELISALNSRDLEITRIIFQRLTEIGDARRDSRRPTLLRELNELTGAETASLIDRFRAEGYNFLSSPDFNLTAGSIIDISHESLIRCWQLLNNWAREEAESAQAYRRLEDRAEQHSRGNADSLSEREIVVANEQRQANGWSLAWALRYASGADAEEKCASFERTIAYLDRSATQAFRRARRRRIVFWSAIAASVLFACLALAAILLWQQAKRARRTAESAVAAAQAAEAGARSARAVAEDERGHATVAQADAFARFLASEAERHSANDFDSTFTTLLAAESLRRQMTDQGYRAWLRSPAMRLDSLRVFRTQASILKSIQFAPDGSLFFNDRGMDSMNWANVEPDRPVTRAHPQGIPGMSLAFSGDGSLLATGADFFGTVSIYNGRDGSLRCTANRSSLATAIAFDASARRLFVSSSAGVAVLDTGSCAVLHSTVDGKGAEWIGVDPEGKTVAVAAESLLLLNADDLKKRANQPRVPQGFLNGSAFHLPSWRMAIAPGGFAIQVWDLLRSALVVQWLARNVHSLALSPDGLTLAASTNEGLRLFDLRTNQETNRLRMESTGFVAFSPDGRQLAVIVRKDVHLFAVPPVSQPSAPAVASGSTSPDGKFRAVSSAPARIVSSNGRGVAEIPDGYRFIGFTPDNRNAVAISANGSSEWLVAPLTVAGILDRTCRNVRRNLSASEWKTYFPGQPYQPTCPGLPTN